MHEQYIINIGIGAALAVFGWLGRTLWDAVQALKLDVQRIEVDLPMNYVRKEDISSRFDKIEDILEKLFDRLDKKVDK